MNYFWERSLRCHHDVKETWVDHGLSRKFFRDLKLIGSYVFGYSVACFGRNRFMGTNCPNRAWWDPIVGAYCSQCLYGEKPPAKDHLAEALDAQFHDPRAGHEWLMPPARE